jgi:serine/threonine protein kinase
MHRYLGHSPVGHVASSLSNGADVSVFGGGECYNEFVPSLSLSRFLLAFASTAAPPAVRLRVVKQLLRQALDALELLQEAGIVHRDLLPQNMLVRGPAIELVLWLLASPGTAADDAMAAVAGATADDVRRGMRAASTRFVDSAIAQQLMARRRSANPAEVPVGTTAVSGPVLHTSRERRGLQRGAGRVARQTAASIVSTIRSSNPAAADDILQAFQLVVMDFCWAERNYTSDLMIVGGRTPMYIRPPDW